MKHTEKIKELYRQYRGFIRQFLQEEKFLQNDYQAAAILAFVDGAFLQWYLDPEAIDLTMLLRSVVDLLKL